MVLSKSRGACRGTVPGFTRVLVLLSCVAGFTTTLPLTAAPAAAAEMDKNAKSDAKTAMRFYKEGNYENAAKIFLKLSVAYPDMLVFVRNLGACYYYLRRYEPALSNLRDYEHRKKDMAPDDCVEVEGWIGEMERLRDQAAAPPATPEPSPSSALPPVPVPIPAPAVPTPAATAPAQPAVPAAPSPTMPAAEQPAQTAENANPTPGQYGTQPQPAYPPGQYGAQPPPTYPPGQYGTQPQPYPPGQYGAQSPTYPQEQYPQPGQPGYPTAQVPPAGGGYPPTYQPSGYPQGGYPAQVAKQSNQSNPAPSGGGGRRAAAWILGVLGGAGIVTGGVFTALALDRFSKVQKKYDPTVEKQGKQFATLQWVCYGSGAALLTTAIIVGATGGSSSSAVALAPAVGPGVAGATLSGRF